MIRSIIATTLASAFAMSIAWAQLAPPQVIILVGPPGSGKTTQANLLAKKYGIPAFSMADLLKKQMSAHKKDAISKALAASIASGDVLPDDAASDLIRLHLLRADLRKGFILDGYPSTAAQAKALDRILQEQQLPKAIVVVLEAPDDVIRKRMRARGRADDKPEIIDRRIQEFRNEAALLAGWAGKTHVVRVNANAGIADVSTQVVTGLENTWSQQTFAQRP
jgi:adenylate kinase